MGMNVGGIRTNPYSGLNCQNKQNEIVANCSFKDQIMDVADMSLEEYKKIFNEKMDALYTHPSQKNMNSVIDITDAAYKRMQTDPEYEKKILNAIAVNKSVDFGGYIPQIAYTHIDDTYEKCYGYTKGMKENIGYTHSKGKDASRVKKSSKHQEEKKRLEEEMLKKAQEKRAAMEDYFEHRFASQQRIQSLFKEGLNVDARIAGVQSSALGAMAIAAYEQNSIIMPIESI